MTTAHLAELDLAVAKAEGFDARLCPSMHGQEPWVEARTKRIGEPRAEVSPTRHYSPTRDGAEAMRLLEKYSMFIDRIAEQQWVAVIGDDVWGERDGAPPMATGFTPAIAICRAVVTLKAAA